MADDEEARKDALWDAFYEEKIKPINERNAKERKEEEAIENAKNKIIDDLYKEVETHGLGRDDRAFSSKRKTHGLWDDSLWDNSFGPTKSSSIKTTDRHERVPDINGDLHGIDELREMVRKERAAEAARMEEEDNKPVEPKTRRGRPRKVVEDLSDTALRARHRPVLFPLAPGRPKTERENASSSEAVASLPGCMDEPQERFDMRYQENDGLKTAFAAGARSALGELSRSFLLQTRTPVHYCAWYRARREAWKQWLVPLEEQHAEFEQRAAAHFSSDPVVRGERVKLPHLNIVDFSMHGNDLSEIDTIEEFRKAMAVFQHKNEWPMMRRRGFSVSRRESDEILFSRESPFYRDPKEPSYVRYSFFPTREPSDAPHECLRETLAHLTGHDRYLRCATTLPDENLPLESSSEVRFVHGSFRDVAEWNLFSETYERFADPVFGPAMAFRTADAGRWLPLESWGEGIDGSTLYVLSLVARFSSLTFPSILPPSGRTLAELPWRDGTRPPDATEEELATFAQVHTEVLSVRAAQAAAKILCAQFKFRAPSPEAARRVRARIKELCCVRYFRLRRIRALVASFGEFMFSPSLFNVQYRLLRVDPRWWPAVTKKDITDRGKHFTSDGAFQQWRRARYTHDERIFSSKTGVLSVNYRARSTQLFWPKHAEFSELPEELLNGDAGCSLRVLYGCMMMRSLESLSISRMPDDGRTIGEERLADWLPETLVYDAQFGGQLPLREVTCTRSPNNGGRSLKYFKGFELEEGASTVPWAAISLVPSSYLPAYQAYAEDAFVPKKCGTGRHYLLPWNSL